MKQEQKIRALSRLASIRSDAKLDILQSKFHSINLRLGDQADHDQMKDGLAELEAIAIRFPDETVKIISDVLARIKTLDQPGEPTTELDNKCDAQATQLAIKCFDVLDRIRYLSIDKIAPLLFEYVSAGEPSVRKRASNVLSELAEFNLTVIYGDDKRGGIGFYSQEELYKAIVRLTEAQLYEYRPAIQLVAEQFLNPTMGKTSSDYKSFTWTKAAVPADPQVITLRENTIGLLKRIYPFAESISEKQSILTALLQATRTHTTSDYGAEVQDMIATNSVVVLNFFRQIVTEEPLEIVQKIEHDSYWQHRRAISDAAMKAALEVKAEVGALDEYQIYKVLIGFEGIFGDWDDDDSSARFSKNEEHRNHEARRFAESITEESFPEWRERIIKFTKTESDDLATFPIFGVFLEHFALVSPNLAIRLLREDLEEVKNFLVSILLGLWKGKGRDDAQAFASEHIEGGENLWALASVIQWLPEFDLDLLKNVTSKAIETSDSSALNRLIGSIGAKLGDKSAELVSGYFVPIIQKLTDLGDSNWVHQIWYLPERGAIMAALSEDGVDVILDNLLLAEELDYHIEAILLPLSEKHPERVLGLFERRLAKQRKREGKYDAIPFNLQELQKAFSDKVDLVVDTVRSWFDGDHHMFQYYGADLVAKLFPDFSADLEGKLIQLVDSNDEQDQKYVLSVLQNYDGQTFIQPVCKALIAALPEESDLTKDVAAALLATGVMTGEFGFAEATEAKVEEIAPWLERAEDQKVRDFAKRFTASLKRQAKAERRRAEEELEIRKHEWGDNSDDEPADDVAETS